MSNPTTICPRCKESPRYISPKGRKHAYCKRCHSRVTFEWRKRNPEKARQITQTYDTRNALRKFDNMLRRVYGINYADFQTMKENQNNKCALCDKESVLVVDHDHGTGKVRGLLCDPCNRGLGFLGDNIAGVRKALIYLEQSN